jgi:hypothetical protein
VASARLPEPMRREPRKVNRSLTVRYDRVMYLLNDTPEPRKLIGRYIEESECPDGRIELRADGRVLPCRQYDQPTEVDQGAVVEHKRLGGFVNLSRLRRKDGRKEHRQKA